MRALPLLLLLTAAAPGEWKRHVIDDTSQGADGVRLDGGSNIATGWEEGGSIRVYRYPGPARAKKPWPAVVVGSPGSPEDAVFADLDGDGVQDVVSACEGKQRALFVHWAPRDPARYLHAAAWKTEPLPAAAGAMQWMFTAPLQIDRRRGIDFFAAGKNAGAQLGWFESPPNPRDLAAWKWHPLRRAGWIMSLLPLDMDNDGDPDLLFSDRKGKASGAFWLENTGPAGPWKEHPVGGLGQEVMFLSTADLDRDGLDDVLSAVRPKTILFHRRLGRDGRSWESFPIRIPEEAGSAKAVRAGDLDGDGRTDLVFTCENAVGPKLGVMWLRWKDSPRDPVWEARDISGAPGVKYDLLELLDLDADGDLDVLTCEERDLLGVVWYENPLKSSAAP